VRARPVPGLDPVPGTQCLLGPDVLFEPKGWKWNIVDEGEGWSGSGPVHWR
jgi:hypothetical protein